MAFTRNKIIAHARVFAKKRFICSLFIQFIALSLPFPKL